MTNLRATRLLMATRRMVAEFALLSAVFVLTQGNQLSLKLLGEIVVEKRIRQAIAITCNEYTGSRIAKLFSNLGILSAVATPESNVSVLLHWTLLHSWYSTFMFVDLRCSNNEKVLQECNERLFSAGHHWLVSFPTHRNGSSYESIRYLFPRVRMDSDVLLSSPVNSSALLLEEIYGIGRDYLKVSVLGNWSERARNLVDLLPAGYLFSPERRGNMELKPVKAEIAKLTNTYNITTALGETGYIPHDVNIVQFLHIRDMFNFSIVASVSKFINGHSSLIKLLEKNEVDVAPMVMAVTAQRANSVDFSITTGFLAPVLIYLHPPLSSLHNIFLLPFHKNVWLTLIVVVLAIFLLLSISVLFLLVGDCPPWTISEIFLLMSGIFCQQGAGRLPQSTTTSVVIYWYSLLMLLMYIAYSGQIVSRLSVHESPVKSIKDLATYGYHLGLDVYPFMATYFNDSNDITVQQLSHNYKIISHENALAYLKGGLRCYCSTFLAFYNIAKRMDDSLLCKLDKFPIKEAGVSLAMSFPRNGQYREMFNYGILRLQETGLLFRRMQMDLYRPPHCTQRLQSVDFPAIYPVISVLCFGIILSAIIFLIEMIVYTVESHTYCN